MLSFSMMWRVALIEEYDGQRPNVAHYSYAYAALYALENWNNKWEPNKVVLDRGRGATVESREMTVSEFIEWCLDDSMP